MTDFTEERYNNNLKIINLMREYVEKYKDTRFEQMIYNLFPLTADGREPDLDFHRESKATFDRLEMGWK